MISFEYDDNKSQANFLKHGIDFNDAQLLWHDSRLLEFPAKTEDEPRYLVIGAISGKHWSAAITYRGAAIRLISVRRARTEEITLMKATNFDQQFDEGNTVIETLDLTKARRVMLEQKRVNVDFPTWMIESLDREANKIGVTRQSIIKVWLAERLENSGISKLGS